MWSTIRMFALALSLCAAAAWPAAAEEESQAPPSISYGGSRESSTWIGKPGGPQVAVGEGVEWQGVKVYLSLTWDLVGVDVETKDVLYVVSVGAFWNAITFKEVTPEGGAKAWAVELGPGRGARQGVDRRQYHDLRTGKRLEIPELVEAPPGTPFKPRASWHGDKSDMAGRFSVVVSAEKSWVALQERMFETLDPERFGPIDFEKEVVLVTSYGNSSNCGGIGLHAAYEDERRILLRTADHSFQTMNGWQKTRPWGIFVLPRRAGKAYAVERNAQSLIGGPPIWKRTFTLSKLGPPESELAGLPPKSAEPHYGWVKMEAEPPLPLPPPQPPKRDR